MSEIRVENIVGENGLDAVNFSKGVSAAGIVTATGFKVGTGISMTETGIKASNFYGSGANLTGIDAGAKTLLSTTTVSSEVTTIQINNSFDAYDVYLLVVDRISCTVDTRDLHAYIRDGNNITVYY